MTKCKIVILILSVFLFTNLYAQMSELNLDGFEVKKESGNSSETTKSPFTASRPSPSTMLVEDLFLLGTAVSSERRYALISGYVVGVGDTVAGLRVRSISSKKVVLQHLDKVHTLYLEGGL